MFACVSSSQPGRVGGDLEEEGGVSTGWVYLCVCARVSEREKANFKSTARITNLKS